MHDQPQGRKPQYNQPCNTREIKEIRAVKHWFGGDSEDDADMEASTENENEEDFNIVDRILKNKIKKKKALEKKSKKKKRDRQ